MLEGDLLQGLARSVGDQRLAQGDNTLGHADGRTLDHDPIVLDDTVAHEAANGGDGLDGRVELGRGGSLIALLADAVDLLVELGTVVVSVLTGTGDRVHDLARVPCSNATNLTQSLVGLARQFLSSPTVGNTLESVTLSNTDDVDVLVLLEHRGDVDSLLEVRLGEFDLVGDGATVDLDLHQVGLLLVEASLADLGVGENADNGAVLGDALELAGDRRLGARLGVLLGVLGERLLLRAVPVLVESALDLVGEVLSPDGGQRAETTGGLDVADNTDDDHRRSLENGNSLNDLTLVHL